MATRYTDEFRRDAVRIAVTSGLTGSKVASKASPSPMTATIAVEIIGPILGTCHDIDAVLLSSADLFDLI